MSATRASLAADLRHLGLTTGDRIVMHSSFRSIGRVEGGPATVIEALLDVVGPEGLIVAPTFTYQIPVFDPATSPGLTGAIPETIRSWPGGVRSWHPTHAVTALGQGAVELCANHHQMSGLAIGSPLDQVAAAGGSILLLGVGHVANSTVHVGESHAQLRFLDVPFGPNDPRETRISVNGTETIVPITNPPGCSKAFGAIERPLRDRNAIRDGKVGSALCQLMRGQTVIETTVDIVTSDPDALLCTDPRCYRCTESRRVLKESA